MSGATSAGIELTPENLSNLDSRVAVPRYDRSRLQQGIVHIGVGGFHRAHQAEYLDDLCNDGLNEWSITGAGVMSTDSAMATALHAQSGLYTLMTRSAESTRVRVIGTVVAYLHAFPDLDSLTGLCAAPSTRIVSLTITEGGYPVDPETGVPVNAAASPAFAAISTALEHRHHNGVGPFTVLSCDNVLRNGDVAKKATLGAADEMGHDVAWMEREVAFPSSMVDRITPATTDEDRAGLTSEYGIVDRWPVVSEPFRQWVIEDEFCQGRPPWESAGALITDDVTPYEQLKLRVLNAGHSTLAYLAALAGYELVDQVMEDPWFAGFLTQFLHDEVIPVLPPVPGVDVRAYTEEIIERFSNPAIRDQVSRLCLDGSSKFPTFLMPTIRAQLEGGGPIELSALALAGWCQYLLGKSDSGADLDLAADSKLDSAVAHARSSVTEPAAFLGFTEVFGEVGSHPRIQEAFVMALISLRQHGSRTTLKEWLANGDGGRSV